MSNDDDKNHDEKKVTAATTDAPQEEFISPVNRPSVPQETGERLSEKDEHAPPKAE